MKEQITAVFLILLASLNGARARPAEYPGPYVAEVIRVLDADTLRMQVKVWPTAAVMVSVRLRGVDTPEGSYRARCDVEREAAERATNFVRELLPTGTRVRLENVRLGKYAGRVVATVKVFYRGRWADLSRLLIHKGFGRPYNGGRRAGWCPSQRSTAKEDKLQTQGMK